MNKRVPTQSGSQVRPHLACHFDRNEGLDDSFADYAVYRLKEAIEPLMPNGCRIIVEGKTLKSGMFDDAVALTARINGLESCVMDLVQHGMNEWVALKILIHRLETFFLTLNECNEPNERSFAE